VRIATDCRAPVLILIALLLACLATLFLSLSTGSIQIPPAHLWSALTGDIGIEHRVIWDLRLPRALTALAVGGLLALAGTLMQVLLRNPLGDPYVLGVSGGASVAVLLAMLAGAAGPGLTLPAFGGAIVSMLLVFTLAHGGGAWTSTRLLLTGVVIAAGWGAMISLVISITPPGRLPGMLFWLMGDLSDAERPLWPLLALAVATALAFAMARPLNLMTRGEDQAAALGVEVRQLRLAVFVLGSLITGVAVTVAGAVGFVGLVAPHLFRLFASSDHRLLIPGSVLTGALLLLLADTLARTVLDPREIPVGVVTALIGVPLFLYLLQRTATKRP
jgi:iron complex transport system permease protein